jgi:hypothetical protein
VLAVLLSYFLFIRFTTEAGGELGGAAIVVAISVVWIGLFIKLLQRVGL